jgi:O-antigen chain-terminating methyltransferase
MIDARPKEIEEIDVAALKARIREAVARREAEGKTTFINASIELHKLLSSDSFTFEVSPDDHILATGPAMAGAQHSALPALPRFRLQPVFAPHSDDHYHVNDLLIYHDAEFVWNAYRALLKRDPDEEGYRQYLGQLREGRLNKIDVLRSIRFSPEGRRHNVRIDGLALPAFVRRLYRIPALGYLLELVIAIARLPVTLRQQRQFDNYLLAQQERLAAHANQITAEISHQLNRLHQAHTNLADSTSAALSDIAQTHQTFINLQHQQLMALYRAQQEIARGQKAMVEPNSRHGMAEQILYQHTSANKAHRDLDRLYASLMERFRGSQEETKQGLKVYLQLLKESGITANILDVGCGRGEWLELLREEGLQGRGVEINRTLAEQGRKMGFEIIEGDALAHLRSLPDNSLQAVTGFHFIEHLAFEALLDLLDETLRTLRPGGLVIFETPNPKNLVVGACNFYADPSHRQPLFPETIQFILQSRGFADVGLIYLRPVENCPFDDGSPGAQALQSWFFGPRDFAVTGRKPWP